MGEKSGAKNNLKERKNPLLGLKVPETETVSGINVNTGYIMQFGQDNCFVKIYGSNNEMCNVRNVLFFCFFACVYLYFETKTPV